MSSVKIVSDGTCFGTEVLVNGEKLEAVSKVEWELDAQAAVSRAVIHVQQVELDITDGREFWRYPRGLVIPALVEGDPGYEEST